MNIYQKIFAYIVVFVTFGAGAFHTLATFSPVLADIISKESIIPKLILSFVGAVFIGSLVLMATKKNKEQ